MSLYKAPDIQQKASAASIDTYDVRDVCEGEDREDLREGLLTDPGERGDAADHGLR